MKSKTIKSIASIFIVAYFLAFLVLVYVGGSVVVSGIKSVKNDCSSKYPIEKVFAGDWFCPIKQK